MIYMLRLSILRRFFWGDDVDNERPFEQRIFSLKDEDYSNMIKAAHTVAQHLKARWDPGAAASSLKDMESVYSCETDPHTRPAVSRRQIFHPIGRAGLLLSEDSHVSAGATFHELPTALVRIPFLFRSRVTNRYLCREEDAVHARFCSLDKRRTEKR